MSKAPSPAKCLLCTQNDDCYGFTYDENSSYEVIHIASSIKDLSDLLYRIKMVELRGHRLRLLLDSEVPEDVIWMAGYDPFNTVQVNINAMQVSKMIPALQNIVSISDKCGLPVNLVFYGINLESSVADIIQVIDIFRNYKDLSVNLLFDFELSSKSEYFNSVSEFEQEFCRNIFIYTDDHRIHTHICRKELPERAISCTGIIRRKKKDENKEED